MVFLYNLFIKTYFLALKLASAGNSKAALWIKGRHDLFQDLNNNIQPGDRIIWVHCASAGELEQGKPVIEQLKKDFPSHKILVSVFSPSGYNVAKKYREADILTYLPLDQQRQAELFVDTIKPELVIFIKYEYWYHHLKVISERKIPLLLVSSIFRKEQVFFKWYGGFYRKLLSYFSHIFVQDEDSLALLHKYNIKNCTVAGDTRFDRVIKIARQFEPLTSIEQFRDGKNLIVAGSTWKEDEESLKGLWNNTDRGLWKLIIAPHEIHAAHLQQLSQVFPEAVLFSRWKGQDAGILIIDNIGMLSRLYHYASICYIGGGYNKSGIHNTLEAAVYGKPIFFGPNYGKFREARELITSGGAFAVKGQEELTITMGNMLEDPQAIKKAGEASATYVAEHTGATSKVLAYIQENRLLTS